MKISITTASADAAEIASLRNAVAADLTGRHGAGHWSSAVAERGVERSLLRDARLSRVLVARNATTIAGTLTLVTKKPWAIDTKYFTPVRRALYLLDMAVAPDFQRTGIGRRLLDEAESVARTWPADAIRLDSYDAVAGAGAFYAKCGYTEVGRVTYRGTPLVYFERLL